MSKRPLNPKVGLVAFLIVAVLILGQGVRDTYGCFKSSSWPHTPGIITKSYMAHGKKRWIPMVEYSYSAGATSLTSSRIRYGSFASRASKTEVLARFRKNTAVSVYYDPDEPARAVLIPGFHSGLWAYPLLTLGFAGAGYFFGLVLPKIARNINDNRKDKQR